MPPLKNKKHEKFLKTLIKTGSQYKSYQTVYKGANEQTAKDRSCRIFKDENVRNRLAEMLEAQGLGVPDLNEKLKDLTTANKCIIFKNNLVDVPDNSVRLESVKTAYKLHNLLSEKQADIDARQIHLTITNEDASRLDGIADKLSKVSSLLMNKEDYQTGEIEDVEAFR